MVEGLHRGLTGHHQPEQGSLTWLDIVSNDKEYVKKSEVWEVIRKGMGKLWRTCPGGNPGARKGNGSAGHEEG